MWCIYERTYCLLIDRLLQRGSMFVFSTNQLRALLDVSDDFQAEALLDLGEILLLKILGNLP